MKTKHTPGPWRFTTSPQPNGCPIVGSNGLMICMLAHSINHEDQKEEALANAALIAAAPELYEACVAAESILSNMDTLRHLGDFPALDSLRAALQKATIGHQ